MNKTNMFKLLKEMSKVVCMKMCPSKLSDCNTEECEFQRLLVKLVEEIGR